MMKMLPALAPDTSITENGHYLVRPNGHCYEIVNTVTDEVVSYEEGDSILHTTKEGAEKAAVSLAQAALDAAPVE